MFNSIIDKVKAFFAKSWSIFIARVEVFTGFLLGVFGGIDWTALSTLDWSDAIYSKNNLIFAGLLILKGIISEVGRRAGTVTTTNDQLVPVNIATKEGLEIK